MHLPGFYRIFTLSLLFLAGSIIPLSALAEEKDTTGSGSPAPAGFMLRPTFGLGVGTLTFMGDIGNYHKGLHPTVSRIGYDLRVTNPLTEYLDASFYVMFGTVSSSERSATRNLNFQSQIRTGGMVLNFNFAPWLPGDRKVEPFIFAGIESFEFLSKTDLYDRYGNYYNYWSDGSIRNIAENDPNAVNSIMIQRDYHYESDVRELNLDGFGKYPERSWAIPIGVGAYMHLNERWKLRIGASMHFSTTDLVDGITDASTGDRKGDSKKDRFLFSSFSVNYDLQRMGTPKIKDIYEDEYDSEYLALDTVDSDGDLVVDFIDHCAQTPAGVKVNEEGCPLDTDNDGVPDYRDDEQNTAQGNPVTDRGVTLTPEELERRFLVYSDSTGQYVEYTTISVSEVFITNSTGGVTGITPKKEMNYVVVIGKETKAVTANELHKYLHFKDFRAIESGDTTYYVVGNFKTEDEAKNKINELAQQGFTVEGIATTTTTNTGTTINPVNLSTTNNTNTNNTATNTGSGEILYRVQIGAFKEKVSRQAFKDVPNLISVVGKDGLTRYYSGAFKTPNEAATHKMKMLEKGYPGSFIVAYKDEGRIPLDKAGIEFITDEGKDSVNIGDGNIPPVNKDDVKFRVQVGAFKSDVPTEILDIFLEIGNIVPVRDESGMTRYFTVNFSTPEEARAARDRIVKLGLPDAFLVGSFNGKIIPFEDALKLIK